MTVSERIIREALLLPPAQRLAVIDRLWDGLAVSPEALPLSDEQRRELDRRIEAMDHDPTCGVSWEDVKSERRKQG
ncbi:MAG: addiction module protein [Phycisphaerales bacterium]|nr:MAG: addiction module protein [Phycisphaerales bacterium]